MTKTSDTKATKRASTPTPGPLFEASAPLSTVLAWPALPAVLRRALTRAVPTGSLSTLTFGESVRAWRDPALREWIVALLALDVGVGFGASGGYNDSMIGLLAHDELDETAVSRFFIGGVEAGQGLGASFRAETPEAPASVCAAAFVYREAKGTLDFLKVVPMDKLDEVQMVKPLGEMPKWKVVRQVIMTHGFMHLGEINGIKGQLGLGFFI